MSYEDFDKKVRDAAGRHHPTYDEQAWGKMESLLEKHMPEKKEDRRRFIFFFLFFLLLGGAVLLIVKPWSNLSSITAKEKMVNEKAATEQDKTSDDVQTGHILSPDVNTFPNNSPSSNGSSSLNSSILMENENSPQSALSQPVVAYKETRNTQTITQKKNDRPDTETSSENITSSSALERKRNQKKTDVVDNPATQADNNNQQTSIVEVKKDDVAISQSNTVTKKDNMVFTPVTVVDNKTTSPSTDPLKEEAAIVQQKEIKKKKPQSNKSNSFFFSLSAGLDVSAAGREELGKMKLLAGFGLGYTFNNKLTVRTGFYRGRKVYAASPAQYNPPADFWNYYPYLEKVEADCKVYEIPVSLSYNFGKSTRQNWFASAGLSSYLMKKEVYNYYYKYAPNTPTLNAKWTVPHTNEHLFSIVTLSGGYQRKINNSVSLMLEPYIKLPLSGIGYGKVKLNSGGLLMTLSIKPFQKGTKEK